VTIKATLTGNYSAPVTLTGSLYANPVTVAGTIGVTSGNALYAATVTGLA